jgi:hypothetical protein
VVVAMGCVGGAADVTDAVTGAAVDVVDAEVAAVATGKAVAGVANPERAEYFSSVGHQLESTEFLSTT